MEDLDFHSCKAQYREARDGNFSCANIFLAGAPRHSVTRAAGVPVLACSKGWRAPWTLPPISRVRTLDPPTQPRPRGLQDGAEASAPRHAPSACVREAMSHEDRLPALLL